jgi:hypothetical protein
LRQGRLITTGLAALAALAIVPAAAAAQSPLVDDTKAEFSAGTAGAATWAVEPGSVRLMPTGAAANFESGLADWMVTEWAPGGTGTALGGTLTLDGARAHAALTYLPPRVLEFRADFDNEAFQHVGLGDTLGDASQPWAIISTGSDGSGLFARSQNANGVTVPAPTPIPLPDLFGPHTFRIEWSQTLVRYFVDGGTMPVAEHAVDFGAATQLRPIASDATPGGMTPKVLKVDWVGMSPSPSSGAFVSRVHNAGDSRAIWGTLTAVASSGVSFETRSGNTSTPDDGTWSQYQPVTGGAVQSPSGQYIQYRAALNAADASVDRVAITYALDETPPNATTIAGVDVSSTTATLRFANTDTDVARFECKLDGGDFAACTSPKQFTGLAAGSYAASVRAIDKVGNVGQAVSQAFTVASSTGTGTPPPGGGGPKPSAGTPADTKAPIVTIGARSIRVSKRAAIRLKCPADETKCTISVRLKYGRKTAGQKTVTVAGGQTVKAKVLLSSAARARLAKRGRLSVTAIVTARDAAGNSKLREFAMTLRPF